MYALQELWRGNITPAERFVRSGSEYKETAKKLSDEMDKLMEAISPEVRKQVEAIDNLRADMTVLANEDYFLYGFRLGARLGKASAVGDNRQYHAGLPGGQSRPYERGFLTDGGRIQSVGIGNDTKPCAVWNGKRQGQGQADRQTASA